MLSVLIRLGWLGGMSRQRGWHVIFPIVSLWLPHILTVSHVLRELLLYPSFLNVLLCRDLP